MSHSQHPLDDKLLLGRYRVMRLLGEGGMGTVHLARVEGAEGFTRPVVVKRMRRDVRSTEEGNRLFIREAKILSKLQHPGIVGIVDFGVEDLAHIMVLEYVHGYTLAPWLDYRHKYDLPLPVGVCLYIVRRILDALHYAHHFDTEEGREIEIVHRDVSPDNVLLSNRGYVHLLDFGIASMRGPQAEASTKSGSFRGKLCYAAPETVMGHPATPRSDQYSAAVVLLELLTGETPFATDSIARTFQRMVNEAPEPPSKSRNDIPPGLDDALARALSKDPAARFDSAFEFSRELRRFQKDDDDVAQSLKTLVHKDFKLLPKEVGVEALKSREQALERILSIAPGPIKSSRENDAVTQATVLDGALPRLDTPDTPANAVTAAAPSGQKQLHGLLWGLLVVGGLIAVGLGAAVALLSRGGNAAEQVVVVGGDRATAAQGVDTPGEPDSANDGAAGAAPPAEGTTTLQPSAPRVTPVPTDAESQSGANESSAAVPNPQTPKTRQQKLSQAVKQKSGDFQACFATHIDDTNEAPKAVLHFSVAKEGGGAQVQIEPSALASTPLGNCLQTAARKVQFPRLDRPVSFRVPVRARISRPEGNP